MDTKSQRDMAVLLIGIDTRQIPDCPASIPWKAIAPYEERAMKTHYQSLLTLSNRGGLAPHEIYAIMHNRSYRDFPMLTLREAVDFLKEVVANYSEAHSEQ